MSLVKKSVSKRLSKAFDELYNLFIEEENARTEIYNTFHKRLMQIGADLQFINIITERHSADIKEHNFKVVRDYLAKLKESDKSVLLDMLEEKIIETGNAQYMNDLAVYVLDAVSPRLEDAVIATDNVAEIISLSQHRRSNKEKLESYILNSGNAQSILELAKNKQIYGEDTLSCEDAIIKTDDLHTLKYYLKEIRTANKERLRARIEELQKENENLAEKPKNNIYV